MTTDTAVLAYLAGFFDGEGSVSLYASRTRGNSLHCALSASNTRREPLELLLDLYGGSIGIRDRRTNLPVLFWQITGARAEAFARDILPFTLVKTRQLELFLHARENLMTDRYHNTPELQAERESAVVAMAELKRTP